MIWGHSHRWRDCESWTRNAGATLKYQACTCQRIHITMFKDPDELGWMTTMWLRLGYTISMEPGIARMRAAS